jgi:dephospho-CoA kinase
MFKVGLTGGIASGKSTVCQLFSEYKVDIIDADIISKELVQPGQQCLSEIEDSFGSDFLTEKGELDRRRLRTFIFNDPTAKKRLEQIMHPRIRQRIAYLSEQTQSSYVILSIPLLIESNMQNLVDRILVVDISRKKQLERLCRRDDIDQQLAEQMINSQVSRAHRLSYADDVIDNNGQQTALALNVKLLHNQYLNQAISPK